MDGPEVIPLNYPAGEQHTLKFTINQFTFHNKVSGVTTSGGYTMEYTPNSNANRSKITFSLQIPFFGRDYCCPVNDDQLVVVDISQRYGSILQALLLSRPLLKMNASELLN